VLPPFKSTNYHRQSVEDSPTVDVNGLAGDGASLVRTEEQRGLNRRVDIVILRRSILANTIVNPVGLPGLPTATGSPEKPAPSTTRPDNEETRANPSKKPSPGHSLPN